VDDVLFTVLLVIWSGLEIARRDALTDWRGARLEILTGLFVVSYFVVPLEDGVAFDLPARNLYLAALLLPAFAGSGCRSTRREILVVPWCSSVSRSLRSTPASSGDSRQRRGLSGSSPLARAKAAATLGLVYDTGNDEPFASAPYVHSPQWFQVYRGGDASSSFAGFPLVPGALPPRHARPALRRMESGHARLRSALVVDTRARARPDRRFPPPIFASSRRWEAGAFQLYELVP
jgi:hypothetical protein